MPMEIHEEDDSSGKLLQEAMQKKSIQPLSETLWTARIRSEEAFSKLFARALVLVDVVGFILQPRRRVGRQIHRDNPNVDSAEQLWRVSIFYAFLDHVCTELERRFPQEQRQMMMDQYLVPGKFDYMTDECIDEIREAYNPVLPDIENWHQEILSWKTNFTDQEYVPNSL
ncbi:unnamed protein product [Mytilus coruscus]|uniref:Uncharacterized protein n=1 Tax=Mytilus coruscus TaxID=42192 RepID=A0A6J8A1E4_MYTCO|nr:unnamed protein product [Mytilus coruscus]